MARPAASTPAMALTRAGQARDTVASPSTGWERRRRAETGDAVRTVLDESSHRTLTLAQVASPVGISEGLGSYYFPTKDALMVYASLPSREQAESELCFQAEIGSSAKGRPDIQAAMTAALGTGVVLDEQAVQRNLRPR
jgi:hypothetical protein